MSFKIYRHAGIRVPKSLLPKNPEIKEIEPTETSFKAKAKKAVGGVFAFSGAGFLATPVFIMMSTPIDIPTIFIASTAGLVSSAIPVIGSYFNKTYDYVPFKQRKPISKPDPEPTESFIFEPYHNWDEAFVRYADRLVGKEIPCDTSVGFTTVLSRLGAGVYKLQQERIKGSSNISWSGIYGEVSEHADETFFRTQYELGSVLFYEGRS